MRFLPSRIQTRIIYLSAVPLAFLLILLGITIVLLDRTEQTSSWSENSARALAQSDLIATTLGNADRDLVDYFAKRTKTLDAYRLNVSKLPAQIAQLRSLVTRNSAEEQRAVRYGDATQSLVALLQHYMALRTAGHKAAAEKLGNSPSTRRLGDAWVAAKARFDAAERAGTIARFEGLRHEILVFGIVLLLCCIIGILVTLAISTRFGVTIAQRLARLAQNARRLGAGERAAPIGGNDEIAQLDRVYQDMFSAYQREHHVASTLQRALLPQTLPALPELEISTAYAAAAAGADIGGDWYDVFTLHGGYVAIGVGDVSGHGLRAATAMGIVRQSIRIAAADEDDPASILERVNRQVCTQEGKPLVTTFLGMLDPRTGVLRYAAAGHPPPIVILPDGGVRMLDADGLVLGIEPRARYETREFRLDVSSNVVLYTDGIVEVERDYIGGVENLVTAVRAESRGPSDGAADRIANRIFSQAAPFDDSAILFIRLTGLRIQNEPEFVRRWTLDAKLEHEAVRVRHALLGNLAELPPQRWDLSAAETIYGELIGNVARHTPGPAEVILSRRDGYAELQVRDRGAPFSTNSHRLPDDPLAENGRGLYLVRALALDLRVERTQQGNCISATLPAE